MYICMFMVISKMSRYRITRQVVTEKIARDGPAFLKYLCVPPRAQVPRVCLCGPCSRFLCIVQEPLFLCWGLYFKFFHYKAFSLRMRRLCWLRLLARPVLETLSAWPTAALCLRSTTLPGKAKCLSIPVNNFI